MKHYSYLHDHVITTFFPERTTPLHSMLLNCGHQKIKAGDHYSWDGLLRGNREFVIWQYTLSGHGIMRLGKTEERVDQGNAMLLIVPEDHCYYFPDDADSWEFIFVTTNGAEQVRLARELRRRDGSLIHYDSDAKSVMFAEKILWAAGRGMLNNRYKASAVAYEFIMTLLSEPSFNPDNKNEEFLKIIHQYCLSNIIHPLDVAELAEAVGYSRWHFSRRFLEAEGKTPHQFVVELKMRMAIRLLQTTRLTVKEIAAQCGFADVGYFIKVFKSVYKCTPAGFREVNC
ncbi:MAG: helix-turn-helix transcriptional regulator [Victivallaceae bacterium]|nr:helix-turn-helix transcriptional regulator [Victivallaceae bacterium]